MRDRDWEILLNKISAGKCTPIVGNRICLKGIPKIVNLPKEWANEHGYPFADTMNLPRIAQFISVKERSEQRPKEYLNLAYQEIHEDIAGHTFQPDDPHGLLARLPFPTYLTTTYDDCLLKALSDFGREPQKKLYRWWERVSGEDGEDGELYDSLPPSFLRPVVYYLHGHYTNEQSLVLTEDDYFNFLVNTGSRDSLILPPSISKILSTSSLLFIGYQFSSWDFRVCLHLLNVVKNARGTSVTVVLLPDETREGFEQDEVQAYLEDYFANNPQFNLNLYIGNTHEFLMELIQRWEASEYSAKFRLAHEIPATRPTAAASHNIHKRDLRDILLRAFNLEDLASLCINIEDAFARHEIGYQVNLEMVGGQGKEGVVVQLIDYLDRRNTLDFLINAIEDMRPGLIERAQYISHAS